MNLFNESPVERLCANVREGDEVTTVVCVSTDWPREAFFQEFDRLLAESEYRNEYALAQAAGVSHSTISSWRSGRQRPSTKGLAAVARALGTVTALELWELAGLVAPGTTSTLGVPSATEAALPITSRQSPPELRELADLYNQLDDDGRQSIRTQLQMAIMWARGQLSSK